MLSRAGGLRVFCQPSLSPRFSLETTFVGSAMRREPLEAVRARGDGKGIVPLRGRSARQHAKCQVRENDAARRARTAKTMKLLFREPSSVSNEYDVQARTRP